MPIDQQSSVEGRTLDAGERFLSPYPEVSVVVTARNAAGSLQLLFDALEAQTIEADRYELILVDDASEDDTVAVARRHRRAQVICSNEHVGLPAGRNLGIRAARGELVAFTDADCLPDATWLELGVERMTRESADILAGGITIPVDERASIAALVDSAVYLDQEKYTQRGFGAGANLWIRRDVFDRVGLFDERLPRYGGDEEELCQRAIEAGARLVYAPEVHLKHPPRMRKRDLARKAFRLGYGLALHRRYNRGPLGRHPRMFLEWRRYMPRRRVHGLERVRVQIGPPGIRRLVGMYLVQHVFVQVPLVVGDLTGELRAFFSTRFGGGGLPGESLIDGRQQAKVGSQAKTESRTARESVRAE